MYTYSNIIHISDHNQKRFLIQKNTEFSNEKQGDSLVHGLTNTQNVFVKTTSTPTKRHNNKELSICAEGTNICNRKDFRVQQKW
jgi:hypothetical protein